MSPNLPLSSTLILLNRPLTCLILQAPKKTPYHSQPILSPFENTRDVPNYVVNHLLVGASNLPFPLHIPITSMTRPILKVSATTRPAVVIVR